uniref:CSON010272 protein n=1 Tax=Culicoides sonorensis TaxID=179676 RepID=A0A336M5C4_CULSO
MYHLKIIFSVLLYVIFFVHSSTAIHCYNCNSALDPNCVSKNLSDKLKVSCEEFHGKKGFTACRTVIQEIHFEILGGLEPHTRVIRQCSMVKSNYGKPCKRTVGRGWRRYDCDCFTEECNTLNSLDEIPKY